MKKITFYDRIQARIITPYVDNYVWKIQEKCEHIVEVKRKFHPERISFFYSDESLRSVKPVYMDFLAHHFSTYIYQIKDAILEPDFGWVITKAFRIFKYSFPFSQDPWDIKKRRPKTFKYLFKSRKIRELDHAASIKFGWQNYYHFYMDALTQLAILNEFDPENKIPFIVPADFAHFRFVQDFMELSDFIKRKIIIQSADEFVKVKNLYLIKDSLLSENVDKIIDSLSGAMSPDMGRKIFIIRTKETGRTIINMEEVEVLLKRFGYESIDCSQMSLKEQINVFSAASHVIGIHGAGLVNILFRKSLPLLVLEIFPDNTFAPEHYKNISKKYGYWYSNIIGHDRDENNNFKLDVSLLEEKLKLMNSQIQ